MNKVQKELLEHRKNFWKKELKLLFKLLIPTFLGFIALMLRDFVI